MARRKTGSSPLAVVGYRKVGVVVTDPTAHAYVLTYDEFRNALGLSSSQYMPVTVGGLTVSAGDTLIAFAWDNPTS